MLFSWFDNSITVYFRINTYLLLLLVEVVDDDSDEEVEGEEGSEEDEEDEVDVHVDVDLADGLKSNLRYEYC